MNKLVKGSKMTKIDPILAVKDVHKSAQWYQSVFGCTRTHGGDVFAVLKDENGEVFICLHQWGEHEHPTMTSPGVRPGNGLILYCKTDHILRIRQRVLECGHQVEQDIHINPNSAKKEFSLRDPDGYYWMVTEFHNYEG